MTKDNTFGKRLQQIRKEKGLTQEKLAELAGVHEKHISKLELGTYKPSFDTLSKILKVLDIGVEKQDLTLLKHQQTTTLFILNQCKYLILQQNKK